MALTRALCQLHTDGLTFSSTLHPKLEHGVDCGLACRVWCMSISGKLKTDWYWRAHKSPSPLFTVQSVRLPSYKRNFEVLAMPVTTARDAVDDYEQSHEYTLCFVCEVSVTLVCVSVCFAVRPRLHCCYKAHFPLSPLCSGNSVVVKAARTRAQDGSSGNPSINPGTE